MQLRPLTERAGHSPQQLPPKHTHTYPGAPTGFFPGGHRWWKGSVVGGTMASAEHKHITGVWGQSPRGVQGQSPWSGGQGAKPPWSWKHFGHWMSNGAGKFSPCICISTLGATVMIWKKIMLKSRGSRDPLAPSWGRPWIVCYYVRIDSIQMTHDNFNLGFIIFQCCTNDRASYVLSYGQALALLYVVYWML